MSVQRQLRRTELKNKIGNNAISRIWENQQIKRYGFKNWWKLRPKAPPCSYPQRGNTLKIQKGKGGDLIGGD